MRAMTAFQYGGELSTRESFPTVDCMIHHSLRRCGASVFLSCCHNFASERYSALRPALLIKTVRGKAKPRFVWLCGQWEGGELLPSGS